MLDLLSLIDQRSKHRSDHLHLFMYIRGAHVYMQSVFPSSNLLKFPRFKKCVVRVKCNGCKIVSTTMYHYVSLDRWHKPKSEANTNYFSKINQIQPGCFKMHSMVWCTVPSNFARNFKFADVSLYTETITIPLPTMYTEWEFNDFIWEHIYVFFFVYFL